jgi:hypothetical protein
MRNVVRMAAAALGVEGGKLLFGVEKGEVIGAGAWAALDDVVMGGSSLSYFVLDPKGGEAGEPCGVFTGNVTTANRGGYVASVGHPNPALTPTFPLASDPTRSRRDGLSVYAALRACAPRTTNPRWTSPCTMASSCA